jgi:hypothetical protein
MQSYDGNVDFEEICKSGADAGDFSTFFQPVEFLHFPSGGTVSIKYLSGRSGDQYFLPGAAFSYRSVVVFYEKLFLRERVYA